MQNMPNNTAPANNGGYYVDPIKLIILCIVTCGIYEFYWIYKVTEFTNQDGAEYRNPVNKLLLCLFVPFYFLYWIYVTCKKIETISAQRGVPANDVTVLAIVFYFVFSPVTVFVMQNSINKLSQ